MQITFKATRYELTPEARQFAEKKFAKLERYENDGSPALLEIEFEEMAETEKDGANYRAEANLTVNGELFRAEARADTLENAVDKVRRDVEKELRRARRKDKNLVKRGGSILKRMMRSGR